MDKYNNGRPIDVPENEREKALAISEWAEGNEHLQNALAACIDSGIQTYASCKGHGLTTSPYISLKVTSENIDQITNIINNLSSVRGVNISLSFDEIEQGSILTVYPNIVNRNSIFDIIATSCEQALEFDRTSDMAQEMVRLHETLRTYGYKNDRMRSVIELHNGLIGRSFHLKHDRGSYDYLLENELAKSPFSKKKDSQGLRMFSLGGNKFGKNLSTLKLFNGNLISILTHEGCEMVENDEFMEKIRKDGVRRDIIETIVGKKGEKILAEDIDDKGLAKIVTDKSDALLKRLNITGLDVNDIIKKYPIDGLLKTKVSKTQAINIAKGLFDSIGIDVAELLQNGQTTNEDGQKISLKMNPNVKRNETSNPTYKAQDVQVSVIESGNLRDVYALVHEITHSLYVQNGASEARMILGEVAPQCIERLLDGYLENLSKEQKENFGFDDETLKEDIKTRRISTAIDRLRISRNINKYSEGKKAEYTRYMLAQIYETQFMKFGEDERKRRILEFISALKNNNIQQANVAFDIKINRENTSNRNQYISDTIWNLQKLLTNTSSVNNKIDTVNKEKQVLIEKDAEAR